MCLYSNFSDFFMEEWREMDHFAQSEVRKQPQDDINREIMTSSIAL